VTGGRELYAVLLGLRRRSPPTQPAARACPTLGARCGGANPEPLARTDAPPTATTHQATQEGDADGHTHLTAYP
jgi:hypothetical protein